LYNIVSKSASLYALTK